MSQYKTLSFNIDAEDEAILRKICRDRTEDITSFIRRAVLCEIGRLSYLPPERKKALGILVNGDSVRSGAGTV